MKLLPHWKIALIEICWPLVLLKYNRTQIDRIILTRTLKGAKRRSPYCDTSDFACTLMVTEAGHYFVSNDLPAPQQFLDPSCGKGKLLQKLICRFPSGRYVGIETDLDSHRLELVRLCTRVRHFKSIELQIINADFLKEPGNTGFYDVVILNPPYKRRAYERHFVMSWLCAKAENAVIVGLMPTAALTRPFGRGFRKWLSAVGATWQDLGSSVCNYPVPVSMVVIQQSVKK